MNVVQRLSDGRLTPFRHQIYNFGHIVWAFAKGTEVKMSRQNLFWFLFVVLTVVLVTGCETSRLSGEAASRVDDAVANMIYFVPREADLIEAELSPDILSRDEFLAENNLMLLAT